MVPRALFCSARFWSLRVDAEGHSEEDANEVLKAAQDRHFDR
jgi:hypothetical protein